MKLDKLLKRLKRDLAASPQKAGALGLMVLVALYFWAPLVLKWVKKPSKPAAIAANPVALPSGPAVTPAVVRPATDSARWNRVRQSISQDRLMAAVPHQAGWTNPFNRLKSKMVDSAEAPAETSTSATPQIAPTARPALSKEHLAGIAISSILISTRDSAAVIRGTVYRVNDSLSLSEETEDARLEVRIVGIDELGIDLEHEGRQYRIDRLRPKLSPGDHVRDGSRN